MSAEPPPSIATLVQSAIADTQQLVRGQIELTKAELRQTAKETANASGMFVGAGVLAFLGFVFILVSAAYGISLATGWPIWSGFLIVAVVLIIVAAILALIGRKHVRRVGPPQRSIAALEATKSTLVASRPGTEVELGQAAALSPVTQPQ